ncbi:SH3-domain-containing protein [Armillaria borealis]|uniref:SH3-domain-containing protein n=1 Tax=Armillaria borealis TaxID=47425 RepID=A0AA39JAF8_9AGAR|nr:SH3-domain-containing protein [Armillaria borealis]
MGCIRDMMIIDHWYVTQAETAGLQRKLSPPGDLHTNTGSSTFRSPFLPLPPALVQAKALWAYNLDALRSRDIITIVEETNADWWLGEHNGCKALFPVNYVEKIVPAAYDPGRSVPPAPTEKKAYKPFMTAHPNANAPPPGNISVGLQQDLGRGTSLMAHSAGGVGFGAGAAIGGGLVRAIF